MTDATSAPRRPLAGRVLGVLAVLAAALSLGGCSTPERPATLTIRNDAMHGVDVHYAVVGADGNPAIAGEAGVQHLTLGAGGAVSHEVVDPTGVLGKAEPGVIVMRVLVTMAGAGPEAGQWLDLKSPGPFVVRASPMGAGVKVERQQDQPVDDRQMRDLMEDQPPPPGRAGWQ